MEVEEFAEELFQDVLAESDAHGQFLEDVFFQKSCELLMEAGELESADRASYRSPTRGIRVDGYGGDPREASDVLSLIVLDFHAAPVVNGLPGSEMDAIFRRGSNFLRQALDTRWREALEETSPAFGLADLAAQRWASVAKVRLLLVTNRALSARVDRRPAGAVAGKDVTYSVWDIRRLHALALAGRAREDLVIDLARDFGGAIPVLPAQQGVADHESYLAVLPGSVLAEIYDRWGARLLEQNVRVFLQARGKVNKGIRVTLENEPAMFFAYNNGITATAEAIDLREKEGQLSLHGLRNFQIVNGGQTTASIHLARSRKVDISTTFVPMKLSVVSEERAAALVPRISEFANSQNRVSAADFFANHPFHIRMEEFSRRILAPSPDGTFRQSRWFYERARGQYADARAHLTTTQRKKFDLEHPRNQLFTKTDLAKYVNVWEGRPHEVSLGAQKNFSAFARRIGQAWDKAADDFNEAWFREAVAKAIVFKATERLVSAQPWYQGGYRANIVAYAIAKLAHDIGSRRQSVDFETIWRRQDVSTGMSEALALVAVQVHDVLIDPPHWTRNVTEWAKKQGCWDRIRALDVGWPTGLDDELMSTEERRDVTRSARKDQRVLNGIEAQTAVVNAGGKFWSEAVSWARSRELLTPKEIQILEVAARIPAKVPTDKQSSRAVELLSRLQEAGYRGELGQAS